MADVCVVNASPLIFLSRGGHLPLLRSVAAQLRVPRAVPRSCGSVVPTTSQPVN